MARGDESVQMRVGEAKQRDVGKKRARIGPQAMLRLKITPGDIIEITGSRTSCAVAWPADEDEKHPDIIRIDGQTRKNAGASLDDTISVRKTPARTAKSVSLMPVNSPVTADKEFTDFVRSRLGGLPLAHGDEISVMILGNSIDFRVDRMIPRGAAKMNHATDLVILAATAGEKSRKVTYEEVGGLRTEVKSMRDIVELPLRHPELFARLGIEPHSGILLYGPPGCGKTLIAKVLASESEARMYLINGPEIMNKYYGESEARIRDVFKDAKENSPSIIFIDEIDAIAPKREDAYGDMEKRVVAQILALMDGLTERGNVIVLGATNRPDSVDSALRRPGRFDLEVEIPVPNTDGRAEILRIHTRGMPTAKNVNIEKLASELHGYTGADIKSLCREAAMKAIRRYLPEIDLETERIPSEMLQSMEIKLDDFYNGMHEVVPTAMREFYVERPQVRWRDVGGLDQVKQELTDNLITAMQNPERFHGIGIKPPSGALVYGPPGCGKSLIARAMAAESGANMILVRGPEILSKWMGEAEKAVREIFRKAKASSPCVVILDEMDALARFRAGDANGVHETVLSQLLTEIEDGPSRVAVIGITNRPDLLDGSLLRTGRLDLRLYVPPPDESGRLEIIKILTAKMPLAPDVNLQEIAVATQQYTGADIAALCREAAIDAMRRNHSRITGASFAASIRKIRPTATKDVDKWYRSMRDSMSDAMTQHIERPYYR